nr:hypothetical protein NEAPIHCB_00134 [Escherichia coli]
MYGIGDGVDEEHVDAYCCPFNCSSARKIDGM